ncbi:PCMD domain-containing protein [uncultured Parabacteroides sp.]|uniref:PCMD domain-containing protein n=1 Tax=uncultured Parabacteroides sp. TaxID=512312 RepID=UPI0026395A80|nr:PCMD domain-containing protein [uncultured Parabacteroides sp.]
MVVNNRLKCLLVFVFWGISMALSAQRKTEAIRYGDLDRWVVRKVTESAIIGKDTKTLYGIGPADTIVGNEPFDPKDSPWATSNVYAKISGVTKASVSVYPEARGEGNCARLETGIEACSALGIVHIKVLVGGSLFLGRSLEPVKGVSDPWSKIVSGVPFTWKPASLVFDYKVKLSGALNRIRLDGFSKASEVKGMDMAVVNLILQKRWEDKHGNLYAKRVGTLVVRMDRNTDWVNGATFPILYGDITKRSDYKPYMGLLTGEAARYSLNSEGKNVPIQEIGWGTEDDEVTHMILEFCSSHGGSYVGSPGNTFWVDNIRLGY